MTHRNAARRLVALAAAAPLVLLTDCSLGAEPQPADEAVGHDEDVAAGVSEALAERDAWDEYVEPFGEVLAEQGFSELGAVERRGAMHYLLATDAHGARLELDEQGRFSIADARIDADPCTPEALGIG